MASNDHGALIDPFCHTERQMRHHTTDSESLYVSPAAPAEPKASRKRDLLLAFALLFIPLSAIVIILLAFVFYKTERVQFQQYRTRELSIPSDNATSRTSYYTTQSIGSFTLLGSWASNVAQFVLAPFMVLFTFYVAREVYSPQTDKSDTKEVKNTLDKLVGGQYIGVWHWISYIIHSSRFGERTTGRSRAVLVAGLGLLPACFLS